MLEPNPSSNPEYLEIRHAIERVAPESTVEYLQSIHHNMALGGELRVSALDLDRIIQDYIDRTSDFTSTVRRIYLPDGPPVLKAFGRAEAVTMLRQAGFEHVTVAPDDPAPGEFLVVARKALSPDRVDYQGGLRVFLSTDFEPRYSRGVVAHAMMDAMEKMQMQPLGIQDRESAIPRLDPASASRVRFRPDANESDLLIELNHVEIAAQKAYDLFPGRKWAYLFHEFSVLPPSWVEAISQYEKVFFVSSFCAEAARKSGFHGEAYVVPHGVDLERFHPRRGKRANGPFTFLSVARQQPRKGTADLIDAFRKAFPSSKEVALVIKDTEPGPAFYDDLLGDERIRVIREPYTPDALADLYRSADCFVLPSYAEGFGIPLLEAKACGLPVITTAFGGPLDFCNTLDTFLIDCDLQPSGFTTLPEVISIWARPRIPHMADLMRQVIEDPAEREKRAESGRKKASLMTWGTVLYPLLREIREIGG